MTEEREFDDLARELQATRAQPRPEYARELDERATEWLRDRKKRGRTPFLQSLRIVIPAAAATAAVVVALVVSGGDGEEGGGGAGGATGGGTALEVAIVPDQGAAEALGAPLQKDSARRAAPEGGFAQPKATRVDSGQPVILRYFFTAPTEGTVELAGREAELKVPEGAGRLEISTQGLPAGAHRLEIAVPAAPLYRERIEIGGG
jgi:hypothetical protein